MTVVGVAQQNFNGVELGRTTQVFVPMMMKAQITPGWDGLDDRRWRWVNAFGRLKPGITAQQAKASLQPFYHSILEMEVKEAVFRNAAPADRQRFLKNIIDVLPGSQGRSNLRRQLTTPLWLLLAITGGRLVIPCANVASLLLAQSSSRPKQIGIVLAMGASPARSIRRLMVERLP